jgi:hypothetical protein
MATKGKYIGFDKLTQILAAKGIKDPKALAAKIGRNKYGKEKFQQMAAEGRRKAAIRRRVLRRKAGLGEK